MFRKCPKARKFTKPGCESTHNVLLHGAEKVFGVRPANKESTISKNTSQSNSNNTAPSNRNKTQTSSSNVTGSPSYKKLTGLLPVLPLEKKFTYRRDHCSCSVQFLLYPLMSLGGPSIAFKFNCPKARYSGKRLQINGIRSHAISRSE